MLVGIESGFFVWALGTDDLLPDRRGVAHMTNEARNLLELEKILQIDWSVKLVDVPMVAMGRYQYYVYEAKRVDGLAVESSLRTIFPSFSVEIRMTFHDCEVELHPLLEEESRERKLVEDVRVAGFNAE